MFFRHWSLLRLVILLSVWTGGRNTLLHVLRALLLLCCVLAPRAEAVSPQAAAAEGSHAFQNGAFVQAITSWTQAARLYEEAGQPNQHSDVLVQLAQAYQSLGQSQEAIKNLNTALALVQQTNDQTRLATVLGSLGMVLSMTGPIDTARDYLEHGLQIARDRGNTTIMAVLLNNMGNMHAKQREYGQAVRSYQDSATHAQAQHEPALAAKALANAASASLRAGYYQEAHTLLDQAAALLPNLDPAHDKAYLAIHIGQAYQELRPHLVDASEALVLQAAAQFQAAASTAASINDTRATAYAWGYLGSLYEEEGRYAEALELTQRAIFAAQHVHTPESLYLWQWQKGRIRRAQQDIEGAITAYKQAVETLQSIRSEMVGRAGYARTSFRKSVGAVYFDLVDLLLQHAATMAEPQAQLSTARETVELLKIAELRDYFQDDCVEAARSESRSLDELTSQATAVIYPILLADRTELLVSLPSGLKSIVVAQGVEQIRREVRDFRRKLVDYSSQRYLRHARQLYDWIIRPLEADLAALDIQTLVFVPDGPLRTIPMAALHDGQQFLIQKYALATTPGLTLTDPQPLQRKNLKILAAGLTEAVQGFPALPSVADELHDIQQLYQGSLLLNQDFQIANLEKELQAGQFTVVHIASHGQFDSDPQKTFLLTFDEKLSLDQLGQFVSRFRFQDQPLELLTLSACETAAGDERAALGLAGIAVKAGARSALATLWQASDEAAAVLVAEFYQHLQETSISRAVALRRAQQTLLDDDRYAHPFFWSPFLLINNWL